MEEETLLSPRILVFSPLIDIKKFGVSKASFSAKSNEARPQSFLLEGGGPAAFAHPGAHRNLHKGIRTGKAKKAVRLHRRGRKRPEKRRKQGGAAKK